MDMFVWAGPAWVQFGPSSHSAAQIFCPTFFLLLIFSVRWFIEKFANIIFFVTILFNSNTCQVHFLQNILFVF